MKIPLLFILYDAHLHAVKVTNDINIFLNKNDHVEKPDNFSKD